MRIWTQAAVALFFVSAAAAETPVERGEYLVNAVMACDGCHTPRGPDTRLLLDRKFSGGSQIFDSPSFTVRGSNITPDRETGIGNWSAEDVKRLMTDGVRPQTARLPGTPVAPQMPYAFYKILTATDLDAVAAYTRSLPAVRNEVAAPVYKTAMRADLIPGAERPFTDEQLRDPVKRGFYLATIAHCMECHARRPDGVLDFQNSWGKGGFEFRLPTGAVVVRNITSHPTAGLGAWSDVEIRRALTHAVGRDGRRFALPMDRAVYFSRMTDADLDALVAWMRALPPLE